MTEYLGNGHGTVMPLTELQLGDTVELFEGPYGTGIVKHIDDGTNLIHFFRPYGHNETWSYTGGVICYTGVEIFTRMRQPRETIKVWRRETIT